MYLWNLSSDNNNGIARECVRKYWRWKEEPACFFFWGDRTFNKGVGVGINVLGQKMVIEGIVLFIYRFRFEHAKRIRSQWATLSALTGYFKAFVFHLDGTRGSAWFLGCTTPNLKTGYNLPSQPHLPFHALRLPVGPEEWFLESATTLRGQMTSAILAQFLRCCLPASSIDCPINLTSLHRLNSSPQPNQALWCSSKVSSLNFRGHSCFLLSRSF